MTPPHPPPAKDERLPPTGFEVIATKVPVLIKVSPSSLRHVLLPSQNNNSNIHQMSIWTCTFSEIAVILACNSRSYGVSQYVFQLFVETSNPSDSSLNIRLTPVSLSGWFINFIGSLLRRHCYSVMSTQFTFELSIRQGHKLITSGPYSFVRHPSYTGAILSLLGAVLYHMTSGSWLHECSGLRQCFDLTSSTSLATLSSFAVLVGTALLSRMRKEDAMLKAAFGEEWTRWTVDVPYCLVPGIF
ncbi:hypothetical protein Hypma_004469 [Hypsizygus marmoreus]|uniref:Protein-S-isoprenylcysteine O-methyltransferase n=1 Tax=Hypsizygus marmoreus TaxID=39966 RepID=A0A369K185_HYPMA|nr:hypothetical protein Hypma_004469 [Hypsizygus marmoreus]